MPHSDRIEKLVLASIKDTTALGGISFMKRIKGRAWVGSQVNVTKHTQRLLDCGRIRNWEIEPPLKRNFHFDAFYSALKCYWVNSLGWKIFAWDTGIDLMANCDLKLTAMANYTSNQLMGLCYDIADELGFFVNAYFELEDVKIISYADDTYLRATVILERVYED